jgi:hypothetical protein
MCVLLHCLASECSAMGAFTTSRCGQWRRTAESRTFIHTITTAIALHVVPHPLLLLLRTRTYTQLLYELNDGVWQKLQKPAKAVAHPCIHLYEHEHDDNEPELPDAATPEEHCVANLEHMNR